MSKSNYPEVVRVRLDTKTHRQITELAAQERTNVSELIRVEMRRVAREHERDTRVIKHREVA